MLGFGEEQRLPVQLNLFSGRSSTTTDGQDPRSTGEARPPHIDRPEPHEGPDIDPDTGHRFFDAGHSER